MNTAIREVRNSTERRGKLASLPRGTLVRYAGVINDERDLEREGTVIATLGRGRVQVRWQFLSEIEEAPESVADLDVVEASHPPT